MTASKRALGHSHINRWLFNRPSSTLVASVGSSPPYRLYFRHVADNGYRPVDVQALSGEDIPVSHHDVVSCERAPVIVYNENLVYPYSSDPTMQGPERGCLYTLNLATGERTVFMDPAMQCSEWRCLCTFNLATEERKVVMDQRTIRPPAPYKEAFIWNVIAPWPDGSGAVCGIGLRVEVDGLVPNATFERTDYAIYDVSFKDGLVRKIGKLPEIGPVIYNRPADTVVRPSHCLPKSHLTPRGLYYRNASHLTDSTIPMGSTTDGSARHTYEDVVTCEKVPFILYNQMVLTWDSMPSESSVGPTGWVCMRRFDLAVEKSEVVLDPPRLRPAPPYKSASVARIFSAWPDGSGAVCGVALETPDQHVDFYLYDVSLRHGLETKIGDLRELSHPGFW